MKRYDMIIVGAGPAGLSAAIEAAKRGLHVVVYDENAKPGGQLFKQIHKFFGSKEHKAKIRGFHIGEELLAEAAALGVTVVLNAIVIGIFPEKEVTVKIGDKVEHVKGDTILVATGASENMVTFPGWTLPGVIGAGAAQTMMNLHGTMPGKRILMLGLGMLDWLSAFSCCRQAVKSLPLQMLPHGLADMVSMLPRLHAVAFHSICRIPLLLRREQTA